MNNSVKIAVSSGLAAVCFLISGCKSLSKEVSILDAYQSSVAAEYREYVKTDNKLSQEQRQMRYDALDRLDKLILSYGVENAK